MDPVIIVGAGPVGLALALDLSLRRIPVVVLDASDGQDEHRLSRTALLRPDTAGFVERLGCSPAPHEAVRWSAWRTLRRRMRGLSCDSACAGVMTGSWPSRS